MEVNSGWASPELPVWAAWAVLPNVRSTRYACRDQIYLQLRAVVSAHNLLIAYVVNDCALFPYDEMCTDAGEDAFGIDQQQNTDRPNPLAHWV
jgi:hypothetical protein